MPQNPYFYIVVIAVASGTWPLITRFSGLSAQWVTITVTIATAIVAATFSFISSPSLPGTRSIMIGLAAGVINAAGMIGYGRLLAIKGVELSKVLPIAFALFPVVAMLGAILLFKEPLTVKKITGVAAAGVAIYLLQ